MKPIFFFVVSVLIASQSLFAQVNTTWIKTLDSPMNGWDEAHDITVDDSCNVFVTGNAHDYMTAKYDPFGELLWVKTLDVFLYDAAQSIAVDHAGDIIVSGYGEAGYTTIKYSSAGDSLWTTIFYADGFLLNDIAIDDSNNIYMAGSDAYKSLTVKYNSDGVRQWYKHYTGPYNNQTRTNNINIDDAGYIYVAGRTELLSGNTGFLLMKYNSNGDTIWTRTYIDTLYTCDLNAITSDKYCNIYLTGYIAAEYSPPDFVTLKCDSSGNLKWAKTMKPLGSTFGQGIAVSVDKASNVYVAGYCKLPGSFSDFVITKYNSNGDSIWTAIYNGTANNNDYLYDMVMDSSANIYVTGGTLEVTGGWNCVTIMYDSLGMQKAIQKFDGNAHGEDEGYSIALDKWNNVLVGGRTTDSVHSFDYFTIKYGENLVEVKESSSPFPTDFCLYQNYPNPFNPNTKISWQSPVGSWQTLKVYDILGNEVITLVDEYKSAGKYEVEFNSTSGIKYPASGVYFYQLKAGSFIQTKKMIVLK